MTTTSFSAQLLAHDPQVSALWEKLRRFSFDLGTGPRTFAKRLASEQGWSETFAALAIEEYRRFLLLFALDKRERSDGADPSRPVRVVPSAVVDEVWHLHLLYTQSYWENLCRDILAGPLHHLPSDGSGGEAANLDTVYADTLAAYRRVFGHPAPAAVWPGAEYSENPVSSARSAGTRSMRAFAEGAVLVGGGLLVTALLVLGHFVPPGFLAFAVVIAVFALGAANGRRPAREKKRFDSSSGTEGGGYSGGDGSSSTSAETHHGDGHHGGSHDGGWTLAFLRWRAFLRWPRLRWAWLWRRPLMFRRHYRVQHAAEHTTGSGLCLPPL